LSQPTRCRFAPSPTGLLHVGGARTALFNHLFSRATQGRFALRSEDTDQARSSAASEQAILDDLRWLGLEWDEGPDVGGPGAPYRQSERLEIYRAHVQMLLDLDLAYYAYETSEELTAERKQAEAAKASFRYRRRDYSAEDLARFQAEGRQPVVRFHSRHQGADFVDDILGEVSVGSSDVDDFVIQKADGFPTYHFAVVIDDHHMGVTHVLRAQEHLMNTARHALLYAAFGWEPPHHAHMPLIFNETGGKMSKRDKAKAARAAVRLAKLDAAAVAARCELDQETVQAFLKKKTDDQDVVAAVGAAVGADLPEIDVIDFRRAGYLPEALVNFLALLGWSNGDDREIWSLAELEGVFRVDRIGKTAARFNRDKLRWMNGQYVRAVGAERLVEAATDYVSLNPDGPLAKVNDLAAILDLYAERYQTFGELDAAVGWVGTPPTEYGPAKGIKKHLLKGDGLARLAHAGQVLAAVDDWTATGIEAALNAAAEASYEGRVGKLAQPIRCAMTGSPVSPPIGGTLAALSQDDAVARVHACLAHFADA
jgi:glutamyl/glutaminyl-tRNA synthetase